MKKIFKSVLVLALLAVTLVSCERVAPNYYGVLMQNYGKAGKSDYSKVQGKVSTALSPGSELFQVPAWEQRAKFTDDNNETEKVLHMKASDNTEFTARPQYSYKSIEGKVVDLVFQNSRLGSGNDFMRSLEDNVLEPRIYDIIKEESRKYTTDTLMAKGGSLRFEQRVQAIVKSEFEKSGLELVSFSSNLDFSKKVKAKIDSRNEVNTNITVLDQKILEQRKTNELELLITEQAVIRSRGLTPEILQERAIQKWNGVLPSTYAGGGSLPFVKTVK
ncbi:SPFH domain-containing protein [Flavobacterium sp.]|uniref:SPFH domain-containing protein n=1 Tax=Flavobacterium sp. TaxID=239 RepID=UPI00262D861B|nr:SPFH domain-containing protein [Flavobacterium sp.]